MEVWGPPTGILRTCSQIHWGILEVVLSNYFSAHVIGSALSQRLHKDNQVLDNSLFCRGNPGHRRYETEGGHLPEGSLYGTALSFPFGACSN